MARLTRCQGKLAHGGPCGIARHGQRGGVALGFAPPGQPGRAQARHGSNGQGKGIDQPGHRAANGLDRWHGTAKHILQLPTLLHQHHPGALAGAQAHGDVGHLRRQPP